MQQLLKNPSHPHLSTWSAQDIVTRLAHGATYILMILMPISIFHFVGRTVAPTIFPLYVTPTLYLSDLPLFFILGLSWFAPARKPQRLSEFKPLVFGLAIAALFSIPFAIAPNHALYTALRWGAAIALFYWFTRTTIPIKHLVLLLLFGLSFQSVIGFIQAYTRSGLGLPGEVIVHRSSWRAIGTTFHPNVLAGYLTVTILMTLPLLTKWRMVPFWCILWLGWFATFSRGALIATSLTLPIALLWLAFYSPSQRKKLLVSIIGAVLVIAIAKQTLPGEKSSQIDRWVEVYEIMEATSEVAIQSGDPETKNNDLNAPNDEQGYLSGFWQSQVLSRSRQLDSVMRKGLPYRHPLNKVALGALLAHPLTGVGAGNFPITTIAHETNAVPQDNVHNVILLLASETGIIGAGIWIILNVLGIVIIGRHWRSNSPWLIVATCAWLALSFTSLLDFYAWGLETGRLLTVFVWGTIVRHWEEIV